MPGNTLDAVTPALSIQPLNFAAKDPGDWSALHAQACGADQAGVDRLVVSDHVVFGENLDAYADPAKGGIEGGKQPTGPDGHWLEPLSLLSYWAAITTRTRLMTGVLLAGLRRPATLAKSLATLDVLSDGRLDVGVGVGWQREEHEANGLAFERRGAHLDQTLEICQRLWRDDVAEFHSEEIDFERIHAMPKPRQPGGVPIWVGGTLNPRALRRIARYATGWIPWGRDARDPGAGLARIREALAEEGRDGTGFQVTSYLPLARLDDGTIDAVQSMAAIPGMLESGVTDFRVTLRLPTELSATTDLLAPIVAAFREATGRDAL